MMMTSEQLEQYNRDGLLFLPGLFTKTELTRYRAAADEVQRLVSPLAPGKPRLTDRKGAGSRQLCTASSRTTD
ncbi:MAG: hypothetical protein R2867_41290 [Caldilineaceae bacterium]